MSADGRRQRGVLLLNLGGPDSIESVRPFLLNLFSDREIIRLGPRLLQKPLAMLISSLRASKAEAAYRMIGGKSPLPEITAAQARALEDALRVEGTGNGGGGLPVFVAMRYWHPLTEDVVPGLVRDGIRRLLVLPLYPHFSLATTGSSLTRLRAVASGLPLEIHAVESWYDDGGYVRALAGTIREGLGLFGDSNRGNEHGPPHVLFSAHSLPVRFIEEGDPYVRHLMGTIEAVMRDMDLSWSLCYQSKSGPVKWLSPSTEEAIEKLAAGGVRNLLVVPVSFVSDHIETLYEIDILYREHAAARGIRLERAPSLNTSPLFITALRDIVVRGMKEAGWTGS